MKVFGTDYDGVIINIELQKAKAFADLVNKYWGISKQEVYELWMQTGGTSRKYKFEYLYEKRFGKALPITGYEKIQSEYRSYLRKHFYPNVQLLDGAIELLKYCKQNFDKTFVTSGMPMDEINYLVRRNGVLEYFDLLLGTNYKYPSKNEHFKKIKQRWNPDKIVFLANSQEDMRVGNIFGARTIGIISNQTKETLKNAGASKIVSNLNEALSVIKRM